MRKEKDSMGEMEVPDDALYGASTQRAVLNFPISALTLPSRFISALGAVKLCAARINQKLGLLDPKLGSAIERAATEVMNGELDKHFVLDVFQTGSGTSTNMNANEVIATRANQLLGTKAGERLVHPNDHVNMSQSSNDVIPSTIHVSAVLALSKRLYPALELLRSALQKKSDEFAKVIKAGRTHLMDATPITLGQEFGGYAAQIGLSIERLKRSEQSVQELALGGTAVGTGLNTHPDFAQGTIAELSALTKCRFTEARNHFAAQGSMDSVVELSGQIRTLACALMKIANDIRWLASGPRCGLAEIQLPEIQPGSSIMPAKVNPVICESVMMVAAHVIGNDTCIALAGQHGNFELNVMLPVISYNLLQSIEFCAAVSENFVKRCIDGIKANEKRCHEYAEKSLATCTSLAPKIGYDNAAKLAKQAFSQDKTVRQMAREMKVLDDKELDRVLDLMAMTKPGL